MANASAVVLTTSNGKEGEKQCTSYNTIILFTLVPNGHSQLTRTRRGRQQGVEELRGRDRCGRGSRAAGSVHTVMCARRQRRADKTPQQPFSTSD